MLQQKGSQAHGQQPNRQQAMHENHVQKPACSVTRVGPLLPQLGHRRSYDTGAVFLLGAAAGLGAME